MGVFKEEAEIKRVIFNVRLDLAERLEQAKAEAGRFGKKLDVEGTINKSLERFLKKAEKKIEEMKSKKDTRKNSSSNDEKDKNVSDEEKEMEYEEE